MSGAPQPLTTELRRWLHAQAAEGVGADDLHSAMRASGWSEAAAAAALQELALPHTTSRAAPAGRLPEPALADGTSVIEVDGHPVQVLMAMKLPRVVLFGGLLTQAECDELIAQAQPRLARSQTVVDRTGGSEVNAARTSDGMFFGRGETALVQRIEQRISTLLNWPVAWGEGLQVLHYGVGAQYRPHHDYFDPRHAGTEAVLRRGGQRVGTLVIYLNTPARGGATSFPDVALEVSAVKGNAVFFSYPRPQPQTRTLHGGAPVLEGEKWVATKWLREREFS